MAFSGAAWADDMGNTDYLDGQACMDDIFPGNLNCTANDVSITSIINATVIDDGCAFAGDTVTFNADLVVGLTAASRWDVGLWLAEDGGSALTGQCTAATPAYAPDPPFLDLDGTGDDPGGIIQDTCGDIDAAHNPLLANIELTVLCKDSDEDGFLDMAYCSSWRESGGNELCTSPLQAIPANPAKCRCDDVTPIPEIPVPPSCDGVDCSHLDNACNVGVCDAGTGECISDPLPPGEVCRPGSGDICDPAELCTGVPGEECPGDVVNPATTICNPGSGDLCDPDESCTGVPGLACPDDTVAAPTTICRPGSGDICDPDESCTGLADVACPDDNVAPATTICNAGSGDLCDPDESCSGNPGEACPDDTVAAPTTICRPGSGDICDPAESCTGVADVACPDDDVAPATTICNPGSGDLCDPDESCSGNPGEACPDDTIAAPTTICRPGSGDICDPDESCTGEADVACPDDVVNPATTICNPGSGDLCDPDESCSGNPGEACPDDTIAAPTTICRPGSGDLCDPDESCTGEADAACPDDVVAPLTTVCNAGSGDLCDPDESCSGNPGEACPDDTIAAPTTICRPGSGDICDPAESCTGEADAACPDDDVAPATTICNPGSGDLCDPDESCSGNPGEACPDDTIAAPTTICRPGSGDICDPDESCTGEADAACPDDVVNPATTICNPGSGDLCDPDESCSGNPGEACPDDVIAPATTICNPGSGDLCDPDESCTGLADEACPGDVIAPATTICRQSGTGDETCDPSESCTGEADVECPPDFIAPPETPCGDDSTTECSEPDTCDGEGICEFNNKPCGSATNSALCEYDMEPAKGDCSADGSACMFDLACAELGGVTCTGAGACLDADGADIGSCSPDGFCDGDCEQSDQFRLLFSPDVQNWTAFRLNASNPGQTFYNVIYDASGVGFDDVTLSVTVPYPYVTVGGNPLHVYDAETVGSNGMGCLDPEEADMVPITAGSPFSITLDDWIDPAVNYGDYHLSCSQVLGPDGAGSCTFDVTVLNGDIPPGGLIYLNVHLDFGLKGNFVDANPVGADPTGLLEDRYDRHPDVSPWSSSDALVNTSTDDGPPALSDCRSFWFEHTDGVVNPLFEDQLQNLNMFKQIAGAFGRVWCATDGEGYEYYLQLVHPSDGVVQSTQADEDGYFALSYKHKGKPTGYLVEVYSDAAFSNLVTSTTVELQGNGWAEVAFWATDCDTIPVWESSVTYGKGRNKGK
jgi:hypothetical protein